MEAIEKHGAGRGIMMGTARICRCHPWGQDGFDPVPQVYEGPVWKIKKGDQANT
jgi:putative component of membrane protein insertase Oxa1/YidC/SpoIIIJ protein YidD